MTLEDLGYNKKFEQHRIEYKLDNFEIGRVAAQHKEHYTVKTAKGDFDAEITGNLRYSAQSREDLPVVGDWVALTIYDDGFATIYTILPRFSTLTRQAVGRTSKLQIIAANVDYAFLVQSVDRDFNINRLERYLTICHSSHIHPMIILTKTDLISEQRVAELAERIKQRINDTPVLAVSNETKEGYEALKNILEQGKTYCMLGSSGVGKSTLLNNLSGHAVMQTDAISKSSSKGRHITSHRELLVLETGGILIDNPGMREIGITDNESGFETTFDTIINLNQYCKFNDCSHTNEKGCAVLEALENGELDQETYKNFMKLEKEKNRLETSIAERRKKEKKFGKRLKDYKKNKYKK
ncbi:MAG: ribosome small subunit-dependent GTPase A [Candidatus Cloacimonetes bacterium]|nr:ribosome small subunit-dependent GTPase A [Candidatus Cloacimonadota bacterium]